MPFCYSQHCECLRVSAVKSEIRFESYCCPMVSTPWDNVFKIEYKVG